MYYHLIPLPLCIISIGLYMRARMKNDLKNVALIQPLTTILAIVVALLSLSYFSAG